MSISCVTVSFVLEANSAAWHDFIGAIFIFPRTKLQCFELVFVTLMYAATPYALPSANICNSNFFVSVNLKLTHLGTAKDDNLKT